MKNSGATPLPVPVMMSHRTLQCVEKPTRKLMLYTQISRQSISLEDRVVEFVDVSGVVKFTSFVFVFSVQQLTKHI